MHTNKQETLIGSPHKRSQAMGINAFNISRLPRIIFGPGAMQQLPGLAARYGKHALLVTGRAAIRDTRIWTALLSSLEAHGMTWLDIKVETEPSPQLVDAAVTRLRDCEIDVVIGIGGGSALDAAKAIAGLLRPGNSVMDYLEGVGPELPYAGPATPFIAVPTTAGTGSEATKNAVLSLHGENGFKKSFRDESLVAEYAVVDPDLLASCPAPVIAANGMDALTQLLESFVSTNANPFTDTLALMACAQRATACWCGIGRAPPPPMRAPAWLMPHFCRASPWRRLGWARYMDWQHRWVRFFRFRTAWHAAPWSQQRRKSICSRCSNACQTALHCVNTHNWAVCWATMKR